MKETMDFIKVLDYCISIEVGGMAMDSLVKYVTENPVTAIMLLFASLLIMYFFFKKIISFTLLIIIIVIAIGGYQYFKDTQRSSKGIKEIISDVRTKTVKMVEAGKDLYNRSKGLYGEAKNMSKELDKMAGKDEDESSAKGKSSKRDSTGDGK
jgi:hypothetical protein